MEYSLMVEYLSIVIFLLISIADFYTFEGDFYSGNITPDLKRQGSGTFNSANGDVYKGAWKDDKRHGKGK